MKKRPGRRVLGTVLHLVDHLLIVRAGRISGERLTNAVVTTEDNRRIGTVYDVFGPVHHPYVSIRPLAGLSEVELEKLIQKKLYVL